MPRPNILFLMSDEHRADTAGFAGSNVIRTPVLDRLAAEGVVFDNAYTPSPVCVPARQCMAAGQLPRTCGVEHYGRDLPPFSMTFPKRLAQYGYGTVCCGKLHHDGPDQMQGWTRRIGSNCRVTDRYVEGLVPDQVAHCPNLGDGKWSDAKEIQRAGPGMHSAQDEYILDGALQFIHQHYSDPFYDRPGGGRPTLLMVSFNRPHYPYICGHDRFTYYLNRVQPYLDEPLFDHPFLSQRQVVVGRDVTPREVRRAMAAYYGMIEELDTDFGRVLAALEHHGQNLDDWWILYTSDHGEMLGEHGIWEKQKFFEASVRVPLVIRPPKSFRDSWQCSGRRCPQNVNLCDLFATFCDATDVPLPAKEQTVNGRGMDSRSLLPLLRGETSEWLERFNDETVSQFGGCNLMIKRGPLKYQCYLRPDCPAPQQREVLFDLDADPGETRSHLDNPHHAQALCAFRARRDELGFLPGH